MKTNVFTIKNTGHLRKTITTLINVLLIYEILKYIMKTKFYLIRTSDYMGTGGIRPKEMCWLSS